MKAMKSLAILAGSSIAAAAFLSLTPALGQGPTSALRGHDSDAPIDVASDRIEVQDRADRAILSGNVVVRQANLELTAPRLTINYADASGIELKRIDASGGVTVRSPSETAHGDFLIYDTASRLITLVGAVTLTRGDSRVNGGRLVLDLDSGRAVMDGGSSPAAEGGRGLDAAPTGRVTGHFTVPRRTAAPTG